MTQQGGFGGFLKGVRGIVQDPMFAAGASIYQGAPIGQAMAQAQRSQVIQAQQEQEKQMREQWEQFTQSGAPSELKPFLPFLGPERGAGMLAQRALGAEDRAQNAEKNRLQMELTKARLKKLVSGGGDAPGYGKTGQIFQGPNGQWYSVQYADNGTKKVEPIGPGMVPANLSPDAAGAKTSAVEEAKARNRANEALGGVVSMAQTMLPNIDSIIGNDRLGAATGWSRNLPTIRNDTAALERRMEQVDGSTLLQGIQYLKGTGTVTEVEGAAASAAVARASRAQSAEDYKQAMKEYRDIIAGGVRRAHEAAGKPIPQALQNLLGGAKSQGWSIRKVE